MSADATPEILTPPQRDALACVLDEIIPPSADERLPGAGELGLAAHVESQARKSPELVPVLVDGLAALDDAARARGAAGFADLAAPTRSEVLGEVSVSQPGLVPSLVFHGYTGYYQAPRVLVALGLEARPPFPKGYELEQGDLSLLDPVRARKKLYRE